MGDKNDPDGYEDTMATLSTVSTLAEPPRYSGPEPWEDPEKGIKHMHEDDSDTLTSASIEQIEEVKSCRFRDVGMLVGGFFSIAATGGIGNAVGLLQRYWEDHQLKDYSPRDVGWIAGTSICLSLVLPVLAGPVFDRYGHFWILVAGTVLFTAGIFSMSFLDQAVPEHLAFSMLVLCWGVLCGMGNGLVNTATSGVVCRLFDKRRGLAAGIVSGGNSVGGVVWPMLLRETLDNWGWRWAIKTMAGLALILLLLGCVLVRAPPRDVFEEKPGKEPMRVRTTLKICVREYGSCFTNASFVWMTLSLAVAQFVVMGIVGTLPSWGDEQGFDTDLLFNFVAVMNA